MAVAVRSRLGIENQMPAVLKGTCNEDAKKVYEKNKEQTY